MANPLDEVGDYTQEEQPPPPPPPTMPYEYYGTGPQGRLAGATVPNTGGITTRDVDLAGPNVAQATPVAQIQNFQQTNVDTQPIVDELAAGRAQKGQIAAQRAAQAAARAAQAQTDRANRLQASDLASRGVPTYREANGGVTAVTDDTGSPLTQYDKSNNIAYDSTGNPKKISFQPVTRQPADDFISPQDLSPPPGSSPDKFERAAALRDQQRAGPTTTLEPKLTDPFEGLPLRTDMKTGDQYKVAKGLPWQWQGVDPAIRDQRMQEAKDKAIAKTSQLIGKKLTLDQADLVAGTAEHKQMMKELTASVPALQDPRLEGADRDTILKAINTHFDSEYAQPQANETNGWFSKDLSPAATQLRAHIDQRKADAIDTANGLYDLKDKLGDLSDRVQAGRDQERAALDTLMAHQQGQPGPLDQPPRTSSTGQPDQPQVTPQQQAIEAARIQPNYGPQQAAGMTAPGNIDYNTRPRVPNADGTTSTVKSISVGTDKGEVLIPTIADDGHEMSHDEAVAQYKQTGKNLGTFVGPESANAFAEANHDKMGTPDVFPSGKPYAVDSQDNVHFNPKDIAGSMAQAAKDGVIDPDRYAQVKPQLDAIQKATDDRNKLIAAAGDNPELKAMLNGAVKGSAFAAGFPVGAGIGGEIGALGGPLDWATIPIGATVGGLISGGIAQHTAGALIRKLGDYNDTIHSLSASSDLHPNYDLAGNLISFGAGAFTKGASKAISGGVEAIGGKLAGASAAEGTTAEAISNNFRRAQAINKAAAAGDPVSAADQAWASKTMAAQDPASVAARYANGIARSYYGSGGGLWNTVQNLKEDAAIRTAASASDADPGAVRAAVAKAIIGKVGLAAATNVAVDTIINEGMHAAGLQPQGETWQNAGAAALLGAFAAGHGLEFEGYNKTQVGDIVMRGKARMDNGIGLNENLTPQMEAQMAASFGNDPDGASRLASMRKPLTPKEVEVYEGFGRRMLELQRTGQLPMDPNTVEVSARQALQGGQPIKNTTVDIRGGEAPPVEKGPATPVTPTIGAGEPTNVPSEQQGAGQGQGPVQQTQPTGKPESTPRTITQPVDADAGAGGGITPAPVVTAGPTTTAGAGTTGQPVGGAGGGTTTAPGATVAPGGQAPVPAPEAQPGQETAQPPAVPAVDTHAVGDHITIDKGKWAGRWRVDGVDGGHTVLTNPENGEQTVLPTADINFNIGRGKIAVERAGAPEPAPVERPPTAEVPEPTPPAEAKGEAPAHTEILDKGDTVYWDRSSHSPELKDKAAPTFLDTARAKVLSVGGKHYAVPHALSGENSRKVDLDALLDVTNNTGDPAILHSKDITSVTPAEVQRSGDGWKIVKKGSVVYGKPKAEAPAEEAPKVATPQELYQKQTDAFNAYKALAHLLSTDPKRVAAWDAYQAAKAEFQKAAEKHGAPPEKPKGKPAPRKGENWLTKPFRTKAEADEFAAERPGTWVEPVTIDGKPAGYHVKFDPTVGPKPPEAPAKVTYSVVPAQDGFEVHDSTGVNHGYFSSKEGANNKIAELEKGAQPPSRGTGPETLPPTETPPTTGEGEPGVGGPAEPDNALHRHAEAEKIVQEYHDALPRGIRVSKLSGQSVPLTRVAPDKIPGGGIGARFTKSTGALDIVYAPEVVADTLDIATENQITLGKTPEEARAIALSAFERGMAGEAGHIREIIISGANVDKDRERVWKELNPRIKALMPEVYNWTGPKHFRDIVMAAEFQRMRFQLAHGIIPEEADFEPEAWAKLLPFLQEPETPWIEARLRAMDDLTKQDTELPFRSDDLNELYQFHAKKEDLSDSEAQQAVLEDALDGYDTVEEAVAAVDTAPPDYVHTTGTDHELSLDAFREAVELAKEQENDPKPVVIAPKPQIVSKVPRRPPTVPKEIGGPGPISDTDISQAEVIPSHEGSGDLGHEYIQMPNGDQIAVTYMLVDSRMVVDNPENEQPDASFKETQDYLLQTTGERTDNKPGYDRRFPFTKDPSFLQGPGVAVFVEGRYMKLGGHRRHYRDLIERAKYEEELPKRIEAFGINKQFVKDMQDAGGWPYLMAVVDDILEPEQEAAIGRVLNTTLEQPKIEEFEAISAARQLTPETLDTAGHLFERDLNKPPLTALKEAAAEDLVNAMFKDGALRETDRSKFIADNGGFTEQGAKFARLVLVGHIIDDVETLQLVNKTKALNKMINGLASLMTMKRRGQDMTKFTAMLKMEQERAKLGIKPIQYLQDLEQNLFDRRYLDIEAIFEWFHSFETPQAKKAFQKAVNDYFPLEKGAEDLMSQNIDLGEGLIRDKNLKTLSMMQPGKFGGMTAEERVLQALKKKEDSGKKLTPAEHDLRLKYEKKLGQKLLIDPNKTPRKLQESEDEFPLDEKPPEPKRAVLGGQSELDILAPGIDKSGQQTLFMQKPKLMAVPQPPKYPPTVTGEPFSEHIQKRDQYWDQLKNWASQIPENAPIVFTNPERPNNVSVVTPVVPRTETALESKVPGALIRPTKAGQWRTTTFHRPMVPQLTDQMVMKMQPGDWTPSGHDEHDSRIDAVLSATRLYPKYSPEVLFMAKPVKGAKQTDSLPGMDNLPEIVWKEGAIQEPEEGEEPPGEGEHVIRHWDGLSKSTGVSYSISEVQPSVFAIHFFNPEGGGADAIGEQSTFNDAKKAAETHLAMWKADNKNRPNRRESYKLEGPKAKESKDQGELFTGEKVEKPTGEKSKPVSLVMNRSGMTQKSRVQFLPERFKKIMKPHQQWGANLALWAFDGGTGFLNNDGPGAGKTVQQLAVGQVMANTKALPYDPEKNNYSKENGLSPKRRPLKQGMVHATLIVTENERIVHNAFAKDAEMLGIDAWRYRGDEVKPDRVYLATYNDVRSGLVKKGTFRTIIFDEAQGLRNAGYETAQALAGSDLSSVAQHVMYATATPFDKPEQIVYLAPLVGDAAVQEVYGSLGITWKRSVNPETGEVDIRFKYPDNITAQDIERVKEAIFDELTRNGKMISRNVPMDNVEVNFVEVPISDEAFIHADAMYRRIYEGVKVKSAQNAGGVAGMTVRAYLENQKIPAVIKKVQESTKKGNQVIVFASRIKEGTAGSYQQGIEGTLDKIHASLEKIYGKNTIGRVYGGDNKRSLRDIDRFQRNEIKVMLGTPNSAGTGINLDDIHGGVPRDLIIVTAPLSAIEGIQNIGRVNRLTTKSKAHVEFLFVDHPVDTWNIDIFAHKLVTLSAMVSGDLKNLKPLSQRTAEIKLNDDAVAVMTVFKREPQFQRIMRQMRTGEPGYISEQEARERLQSPNEAVRKDAQDKADKFFKDIQDETDRQRNNANQMSEDEIMELVDDPAKFSALSPGHAYLQHELEQFVKENTIFPTHAEMIRALAAQMKGEFLQRIDFASNPRMKALGTGGGTYGGRGSLTLQRGKKKARHNAILSNDKGKVFLHEFGHVAYFVLLTVPERRAVARLYAKLGGRSGTQAYFVQGTPQASTSKSRYYSNNVYEFFAESFAQYLYDKRVPGEILARLHDRVIAQYKRNFEMMRRRKDITRESGLLAIYEKGLDLKKEAKHIDYSYPDRSSLLLSTNPPKGLSRRETELWLRHKASIYNSLAGIRPQVLKPPAQGAAKFSTVQEYVTPRARPLPSGTEAIAPYAGQLALTGQKLPKSMGGAITPGQDRPIATETEKGGNVKHHFYILPRKGGGYALYQRTIGVPGQNMWTLYQRTGSLRKAPYDEVIGELRRTLLAGAGQGSRSVWHPYTPPEGEEAPPETMGMQQPRGKKKYASEITSAEGVGVRGEGGEVGEGASLRQPGEIARQGETQKGQGEIATGRGGGVPLRYDPSFKQPQPVSDEKLAAALTSNKAPLVGANRTLPKGTPVSVRIDIPSFLRSGTYAQTVHAPKLGKNIGYDSIVRLDGPVSFTVREGTSAKIRDQLISKAPIAAAEGKYNPDRALPSDINDLSKWTPLGFDPLEHSYFYDKTNDEPVVRADEAISVGNTVYVRNPVHGSRLEFLYMQAPKTPVTAFKSGANTDSIIDAYRNTKSNIGVDIQSAQPRHITKLADYAQAGGKVFVDSGAFGVKRRGGTVDFDKVFEKYSSLVEQSGNSAGNLSLVMPDVLGEQDTTLKLLDHYQAEIKKFIASGARAILPAQNGKLSLSEQYAHYKEKFGPNIAIGIPSNMDATPKQDVLRFFKQSQPTSVHLLGLGETKPNDKYLRALKLVSPRTQLSIDATWHRARVGQSRPITEKRADLKLDKADYTELFAEVFHDKWTPENPKEIKALAESFTFGGPAPVAAIAKAIKEGRLPEYLEHEAAFGDDNALLHAMDKYSMKLAELRYGRDLTREAIEHVVRTEDPNDPSRIGIPNEFTLGMLSPAQRKKLRGVFATVSKGSGLDWAKGALSDVAGLAPTSKGGMHLQAANDVREFLGERNRQAEIAKRKIQPSFPAKGGSWRMFVKMGADRTDIPYEYHPGTEFAHAMSTGKPVRPRGTIPSMVTPAGRKLEAALLARGHTQEEVNKMTPDQALDILYPPELDAAAKLYKELLDDRIRQAERADAPLSSVKQHYFPGYWTVQSRRAFNQAIDEILTDKEKEKFDANNTSEAKMAEIRARVKELIAQNSDKGSDQGWMSAFAKHPLKGPEKFRHEMVFTDKLTAEKFGLEPTMPNPADAIMAKLHELDQSIMANKIIQRWTEEGNMKIIPPTAKPPDGWREFPDPFGKVWAKSADYGLNLVGKRIVPNEYADIIENYLSDSLYESRYFGKPFGAWMAFANLLNQTQLGIGSAFHAGFTSMEAQISGLARLLQEVYGVMRGNRTMGDLGSVLKEQPTAMYSVPKAGDAVLNAYVSKTPSQDPRINQVVRAAELAGAGVSIEKGLRTDQIDAAYKDFYSGRKIRAAVRSPVALIELMAKPIMDFLVPRQKLGVFAHEAWRIIDMNPGKTLEELAPQFSMLWTTIDARLGQVQYKRLFGNNVAKNVLQMFVRAPGWTGGTILQLGGAVKDAGNFFKEWHDTGSLPKDLPPRTAYAISLVLMTAVMNAALTYLFSGKKPEGQDYWAFRTGREDEHGNPERFVLPTYMKDLYAYGKHPGETIMNKTHPAISLFGEIIKNRDYYGVQVRDPDASVIKQAYQSGKHIISAFQPFWWRGSQRAKERGKGFPEKVLPLVGVMPAPRALTQTPAQAELDAYYKTHNPQEGITPEQFEIQKGKRDLVSKLRRGEAPDITKAINTGVIHPRDISQLYKRARLGPIASAVDRLPLAEAEKVYALAEPREREQMTSILERKRAGSYRRGGGRTMFTGF